MGQTGSQGYKNLPRAFPQTHNKTHDGVLSVFLSRHVEVKGQIYDLITGLLVRGGDWRATCQLVKPWQLSAVFGDQGDLWVTESLSPHPFELNVTFDFRMATTWKFAIAKCFRTTWQKAPHLLCALLSCHFHTDVPLSPDDSKQVFSVRRQKANPDLSTRVHGSQIALKNVKKCINFQR